jgi:rhodanese-related sulfurtransferase
MRIRRFTLALVASLALTASVGLVGCSSTSAADPGAAAIAAASADSEVPAPEAPVRVGNEAFLAVIESPSSILIDVRTPQEFADGHIETAVNYDVQGPDFAKQIAALDPAKTYAVYCHSGNRSQTAVAEMQKAGITHIYELEKGIQGWVDEAYPVVYQ